MNDISECYRVLDLEDGASLEEVKRSYRELVKVWHPDRFGGDLRLQAKAEEKLKRINDAFERLCAVERTKAMPRAAEAAPRRDSAPKPSFPHPPKPRPNPPQSYNTNTNPQIATDGRSKINSLIRHPWVIAGLVVVVIVCGAIWSLKRETMSSEAARLLKAANRGDANAQFSLGRMYAEGNGVAINAAKGVEWMLKAAKQNHIDSQLYLGMTYSNGLGVPEDGSKASEWYRKAAESGNATAQYHLGLQYSVGDGVPEDQAKSIEWIRKAAEQGDAGAQFHLGEKYGNGEGIPEDIEKALFWIQKAAIQGHVAAQIRLGRMYGAGFGVAKDAAKAAEWFTKAAAHGGSISDSRLASEEEIAQAKEHLAKIAKETEIYIAVMDRMKEDGARIQEDFNRNREKFSELQMPRRLTPPINFQSQRINPLGTTKNGPEFDASILRHLATDDRPRNGTVFVERYKSKGKLSVENGLSEDAYVKLVTDGRLVTAMYVRANERFTYSSVSNGSYSVLFCTGYGWDAETRRFTRGRQASRYDVPLEFWTRWKEENSVGRVVYDAFTLTLHKVPSGNAKTSSVGLDEFDRF